jgi:hypothetical protein
MGRLAGVTDRTDRTDAPYLNAEHTCACARAWGALEKSVLSVLCVLFDDVRWAALPASGGPTPPAQEDAEFVEFHPSGDAKRTSFSSMRFLCPHLGSGESNRSSLRRLGFRPARLAGIRNASQIAREAGRWDCERSKMRENREQASIHARGEVSSVSARVLQLKSAHTVRSSPTPLGATTSRVDRAPYHRRATSHPAPVEVEAGESQRYVERQNEGD